jgi:DNA-binding MarR family transcriptional regulator
MQKSVKIKLKTEFSAAEESPGFMLWKAANLLQRSHASELKQIKLTPAQFSMMTCLVYLAQSGLVTSASISKHAGLDKMMVSDLVKTLTRKKMITTKPNPRDGRSFLIEPTSLGTQGTNQAIRKIEKIDEKFFGCEKNMTTFLKILSQIVKANS